MIEYTGARELGFDVTSYVYKIVVMQPQRSSDHPSEVLMVGGLAHLHMFFGAACYSTPERTDFVHQR